MDNLQGPPPKGHWRNYQTPTKSAAKLLEEIVAQEGSPSNRSKSSSSDSFVFLNTPKTRKGTPPFPPLPLHPPDFQSDDNMRDTTPPLPPFPAGMHAVAEDDVSAHRERPKSRKSKESKESSSSIPRRLVEELKHLRDRTDATTGTSATNSHAGRHHHQSRTHGRARSASESISSLLVVTTERLARETARANEAERNATELLALFKTTHEAKARLERDLDRVRQELGLYKIQLDVAQKEVFRAQEIVDRVERQRTAAEDDAARARSKIHRLMEARAVDQAMEEGRRLGFEEGLRQGRFVQPAKEDRESRRLRDEGDRVSRYTYPDEQSQASGSSGSSSRRKYASRPPIPPVPPQPPISSTANRPPRKEPPENIQPRPSTSTGPPPSHPHDTPPDTGTFGNLLPRPTITTPMPLNIPPTQPQVAPPMPDHQRPTSIHEHRRPERISIQPQPSGDPNGPIHPVPVWNYSPSVFHERITLPPDNYIPTMDANSVINLPPPHELSYPVPPEGPPLNLPPRDFAPLRPRSRSRGPEPSQRATDRDTIRTKDYAYASKPAGEDDSASVAYTALSGGNDQARWYATMQSRATSALSRGSTHLSDLDLLTTPRYIHQRGRRPEVVESRTGLSARKETPSQSPTQRIAEEWRSANRQYLDSPAPTNTPTRYEIPVPQNPDPPKRPFSVTNNTRPRLPRRPREIVMPAPLGDVVMNIPHTPRAQEQALGDHLTPPHHAQRSTSSNTVPGIEIVTPSTHASSRLSEGTIVNPVLLTPQSANRPLPLPGYSEQSGQGQYTDHAVSSNDHQNHGSISVTLPDNNLPAGFVPLSPIPGMPNLKPYPPGFAPSLPKDHGTSSPDFRYPSSPLPRPT